jgi:TPR repeat protein
MKTWMGGFFLMGFTIVMGVGVAYSQGTSGASPSAQEALKKGNAASDNKNTKEAKKWWRIAAEQGSAEARWHLGATLIGETAARNFFNSVNDIKDDPKVTSNAKEGLDWLLKSAEQGYANAEERLGEEYYNGILIGDTEMFQDKEKGLIWLRKAAAHGNENAKKFLRDRNLSQ